LSTIQPKGERVRLAIRWISNERQSDESCKFSLLVQEASMKFNLSPQDEEFLLAFYNDLD
jgi:hypothetical protein